LAQPEQRTIANERAMSVTIRPDRSGRWEVDIRILLPDHSVLRERRRAPVATKSAAQKWATERERWLLKNGTPTAIQAKEVCSPTLKEFSERFVDGYARANQQKPSGIASKKTILNRHLVPLLGAKKLAEIGNEDIQRLKSELAKKSPKTVNNILSVLSTLLRIAVEWQVIPTMPCTIRLLRVVRRTMAFHDFDEFERLVKEAEASGAREYLLVLLGGEAGLRCGEMMALEWRDVNWSKNLLTVERSDWKGNVTATKGGRTRYVPLTRRLADALRLQLSTRLDNKRTGAIVVVMQRLHERDLAAFCQEHEFVEVCLPAEAETRTAIVSPRSGRILVREPGDLLWPAREGRAELPTAREMLGSAAYEGQYQQRPAPAGGALFRREWFNTMTNSCEGSRWRSHGTWR
jgi:integrase